MSYWASNNCFCTRNVPSRLLVPDDFKNLVDFVRKFGYLCNRRNIRFLADNHWEDIPSEWLDFLANLDNQELNQFPLVLPTEECPVSLRNFLRCCKEVSQFPLFSSCCLAKCLTNKKENDINYPGLKAKKEHEIKAFTLLIEDYCKKYQINRIVDVGCGIGHLLHHLSGRFAVVGIECSKVLCSTGKQRYDGVRYENMQLNDRSLEDNHVLEVFQGSEEDRTAVISLHGCGNLQITLLKLFSKFSKERVPVILTIPCCYHKMSGLEGPVATWALSNCLRSICPPDWKLSQSALRLACQQQVCSWPRSEEERATHTRNFLTRALLECVNDKIDILPSNAPRQLGRSLGDITKVISTISKRINIPHEFSMKLENLYQDIFHQKEQFFRFVEPYTLLQYLIQMPMESLILWDRLYYLIESGSDATLHFIFNPLISPRNCCIIGFPPG